VTTGGVAGSTSDEGASGAEGDRATMDDAEVDGVTVAGGTVDGARVDVAGVTVRFGATTALDRVDMEVAPGEVMAVVGPSGCGKSTLLRAVAGLERLGEGNIALDGEDLAGVAPHDRHLGLMFQSHALFGHLDVAANVGFGLRMNGAAKAAIRTRVNEVLELVGLVGFGARRVDELSGGEAQRVALARALAPSPRLLMLDEPLASLDRLLAEQLTFDLRRLAVELGHTTIHVTHDQSEAFALADRIVVMRDGQIVQTGPCAEVWSNPANEFVARFLGHQNIWGHEVIPIGAIAVVADGDAELQGRVVVAEFQGERWRLVVDTERGPVHLETVTQQAVGDRIGLRIDHSRVIPLHR